MTGFSEHHQNMNILQASTNTNNQDRNIIILRKPNILPQKDEILLTNTSKKRPRADKANKNCDQKPPPLAVARRNARERNRVKQVNNGFATLRQHIPNSIAAAFESSSGRGGNKKLSKVETLRMAVEYIRNLEEILAADGYELPNTSNTSPNQSFNFASPLSMDDDDLSTNPTPPPQQYIKINNTYQLISNIYDDPAISIDENILSDQIINENMVFGDMTLLNSINTNASLSPEVYSDNSLSPTSIDKGERYVYKADEVKVKVEDTLEMVHEEHKENIMHVMAWWEQQQQQTS